VAVVVVVVDRRRRRRRRRRGEIYILRENFYLNFRVKK